MAEITIQDVRKFLSEGQPRELSMSEFKEFWAACTDTEKAAFKAQIGEITSK